MATLLFPATSVATPLGILRRSFPGVFPVPVELLTTKVNADCVALVNAVVVIAHAVEAESNAISPIANPLTASLNVDVIV
ncbi:unannotated protein [freshwater metagenome]|uniref:Unannotated protein n=1 Tax=freshwater metagenome TaxID=449393 RepID=A0A6J6BX66_9ZZZZ